MVSETETLLPDKLELPGLREDLKISRGAPLVSGAPSWVIYDPARHRFFQIGQRTVDVLAQWASGTVAELKRRFKGAFGTELNDADLRNILTFLSNQGLTERPVGVSTVAHFTEKAGLSKPSLFQLLSQRYLFFRIPLLRPERFLRASWSYVSFLFTPAFVGVLLLLLPFGLYLASRQTDDLARHFGSSLSANGVISYVVALVFVKILHELGHAYQAFMRGLRVPTMGAAFMVMIPLLYTDVTDAWRLRRRRDRLFVDAGGVMVELAIAILATAVWAFLPDGSARTAAFVVASTSWIMSLFVNLNPFMRFDGYYILSDSIGVQNLQPRSFAVSKWRLRKFLFGLDEPQPEALSTRLRRWMTAYGYAVWLYRLVLFLTISLVVYFFAFKALGVFLFATSLFFLIVRPIRAELAEWYSRRHQIMRTKRTWISLTLLGLLVALLFTPLSWRINAPAVLRYDKESQVFPPTDALVIEVGVQQGDFVEEGDILLQLMDPELALIRRQTEARLQLIEHRLSRGAADDTDREERQVLLRQLAVERTALQALDNTQDDLAVRAQNSGKVAFLLPDLASGLWVNREQKLADIVDTGTLSVHGYIAEFDMESLDDQSTARFFPDNPEHEPVQLQSVQIVAFATDQLPSAHFSLTEGGNIPTNETSQGALVPVGAWFAYEAKVAGELTFNGVEERGQSVFRSRPESIAKRIFRQIARILVREASF